MFLVGRVGRIQHGHHPMPLTKDFNSDLTLVIINGERFLVSGLSPVHVLQTRNVYLYGILSRYSYPV